MGKKSSAKRSRRSIWNFLGPVIGALIGIPVGVIVLMTVVGLVCLIFQPEPRTHRAYGIFFLFSMFVPVLGGIAGAVIGALVGRREAAKWTDEKLHWIWSFRLIGAFLGFVAGYFLMGWNGAVLGVLAGIMTGEWVGGRAAAAADKPRR